MTKKQQISMFSRAARLIGLLMAAGGLLTPCRTMAVGQWVPLNNRAPGNVGLKLLLADGTIMAQICTNANDCGTQWSRLTPDSHGSYANGTWDMRAPMRYMRVNYSTAVLTDGRVFVIGGEGSDDIGSDHGQVYDPRTNAWTSAALIPANLWNYNVVDGFADEECMLLPDGVVLITPTHHQTDGQTLLYNPAPDTWSAGGSYNGDQSEACWVKLPDDSILVIDYAWDGLQATNSERYVPSLNRWVADANVPINIYSNQEMGAAILLPDSRALFLGGSGHTALYTPTGTTSMGSWSVGPDIPQGRATADAPAAMMANGKVLCAVASSAANGGSPPPTWFYEYDYSSGPNGTFTPTSSPRDVTIGSAYAVGTGSLLFLDLPDGTVLVSDGTDQLYVYQPDGGPLAAGKPAISTVTRNPDGSYHLTGTRLNGISQGAAFGDDAQMDSNYPLVRLTDGGGSVYYARTYNWSCTSVMTGNRIVSTEFTVPVTVPPGFYSLQVVANGIASDPLSYYAPMWVDFTYVGVLQLGTYDYPYPTLSQGVNALALGGTIAIKNGSHSTETMTLTKPMTIIAVGGSATIGR